MRTNHPGPAYRIVTSRLIIRCWNPVDAAHVKAAIDASLEHLRPWMPWAEAEPEPVEAKAARLRQFRAMFDSDEDYFYGIWDRDERQVLGACGLHTRLGQGVREIGYWIHQDHTGQGLATEASMALVRVAFEVDAVQRVEIHHDPANVRSASIPAKLGFTQDAILRQRRKLAGDTWGDTAVWSLMAGEYPASPSAALPVQAYDALGQPVLTSEVN
jgi:RimJ/RimL family protein N-acetyltransferase